MNETIQNILTRRSCKNYLPDMISKELIDQVIEAGLYAASGLNKQSPIILAVTDPEIRNTLSHINHEYDPMKRPDPFYNAPVVLVVLAPKEIPFGIHDGSLVMGNMMLAAHSLGLGSCWIHRAKETFETPEGKEILNKLGIVGEYQGVGNCVLGMPVKEASKTLPKRRENRVFLYLVRIFSFIAFITNSSLQVFQ